MDTKIKFCGITNIIDAVKASNLGVDAVGFIFTKSKRMISPNTAVNIIKELPPFLSTVGVFMNDSIEKVVETVEFTRIDIIQLHGEEPYEYCKEIKKLTGRRIIKRIKISDNVRIEELNEKINIYSEFHILFDPGAGDGKTIDLDVLKYIEIPFILAGGLKPDNIKSVIRKFSPYAVDVSSGIEDNIGEKDLNKMIKFVKEVKG